MTIPKIIHHIWMGTKEIPKLNIECANSIKNVHNGFKYKLWKDNDVDIFMKQCFPEYYEKFTTLPRLIMKIDMFRYFLMYRFGGLYTDMDYIMFKPFDLLEHNVVIPCNREDDKGNPLCLGNCIFASKPNHPFWKKLMDTLFTIDREKLNYTKDTNIDSNVLGTGPMFVFGMWKNYCKTNDDIYIPSKKLFHPPTVRDNSYISKLQKEGYYGMHVCTGLWRNNSL
jgi:inositol phosphorylceramide mannosyltransferase catalytic subunit